MDPQTDELRAAHDVLTEVYASRLAGLLDAMPIERRLLDLFAELVLADGSAGLVGDIGCGTGRLAPYLASRGLSPRGVDLSPEMVRVARRDHPGFSYEVGDVRALPFHDAALDGAVAWYSLMYLAPHDRGTAFAELARVVRPGGLVATAWKVGDDAARRGGRALDLGVEFDLWWLSHVELEDRFLAAGFDMVLSAERPADPDELQPQGYLLVRRR